MGKYLETESLKFNPYNPCVANNITEGDLLKIVFHVYDLKASNKDKNLVDKF